MTVHREREKHVFPIVGLRCRSTNEVASRVSVVRQVMDVSAVNWDNYRCRNCVGACAQVRRNRCRWLLPVVDEQAIFVPSGDTTRVSQDPVRS